MIYDYRYLTDKLSFMRCMRFARSGAMPRMIQTEKMKIMISISDIFVKRSLFIALQV